MKKISSALVIVMVLAFAMPAQAQLKFGVKGGVNLAKASFDKGDYKADNFTGFFIGPMAEVTLPIVGLGVDGALLFSQRGAKVENETLKQNGLEIPVNLKYNIGLGSLAGIYFAAGPSFFFNLSDDELEVEKKKAQVGINLGAGVKLINHLQLGFNYSFPLTKGAEWNVDNVKYSYKNKVWQVSLAYIF